MKRPMPALDTNYSRSFQYDAYGNMALSANAGVTLSGLTPQASQNPYNSANNRLLEATYGDARGNISAVGAVNTIQYDGESRQIYTSDSGTKQSIGYSYDGLGQRMQRQLSGGATTFYIHDAFGNLAAEYNSAGVTPACTTCYLSYDQLGSVRMVTDQNATIVARHDYLPFGEEILNGQAGRSTSFGFGNSATITQMFTGQERDGGTATLDYFNARHFSAVLGSLTQPDPMNTGGDIMNPQSWNAYAYVLGNPLGYTDPGGMSIVPCKEPDSIACVGNDPEPPSDPGNPGCVAYGSEGCIVSPGAPPVTPGGPGPGGSAGGGGGATTAKGPPKTGMPVPNNGLKQKTCSALPTGRTVGVSGGVGGVGSVGGGGEVVINYQSGQVSAFGFGGVQVGWNGGASGSAYTGFVYGLNGSNSNYSGGFTGVNGGAGFGGFAARSNGGLTGGAGGLLPTSGVTAAGVSFGGGLLSGATGGVTATNYSNPFQFGAGLSWLIRNLNPIDSLLYAAQQVCK